MPAKSRVFSTENNVRAQPLGLHERAVVESRLATPRRTDESLTSSDGNDFSLLLK